MNEEPLDWRPRRYQFRISGHLDDSLRHALADMSIESDGADTLVTGMLPNRRAVYAVIEQIEELGLEMLGIRPLLHEGES
jgi:hypothetical protein